MKTVHATLPDLFEIDARGYEWRIQDIDGQAGVVYSRPQETGEVEIAPVLEII